MKLFFLVEGHPTQASSNASMLIGLTDGWNESVRCLNRYIKWNVKGSLTCNVKGSFKHLNWVSKTAKDLIRWMIVLRLSCCFSSKYCREIDDIRILCTVWVWLNMVEVVSKIFLIFNLSDLCLDLWFLYVVAYILLDVLKVFIQRLCKELAKYK